MVETRAYVALMYVFSNRITSNCAAFVQGIGRHFDSGILSTASGLRVVVSGR